MLLTGAQIIIKVLIEQGVDTVFGYPGGTVLCTSMTSFTKTATAIKHYTTCHEQGACARRRRLCACYRQNGRGHRDLRPRRHESGDRYCKRLPRLDAARCHHGKRGNHDARTRQLSGGRHFRRHHTDHKAQLSCQGYHKARRLRSAKRLHSREGPAGQVPFLLTSQRTSRPAQTEYTPPAGSNTRTYQVIHPAPRQVRQLGESRAADPGVQTALYLLRRRRCHASNALHEALLDFCRS